MCAHQSFQALTLIKHQTGPFDLEIGLIRSELLPRTRSGCCRQSQSLQRFLEVKAGQSAADCPGGRSVGVLAPDKCITALAIEGDRRLLHLRGAQDKVHEAELTRPRFGTQQHALRDAAATIAPVKIHAPELRAFVVAAFDPKHADDLVTGFDDPEGVPLRFGEDFEQLACLSVDRCLNRPSLEFRAA